MDIPKDEKALAALMSRIKNGNGEIDVPWHVAQLEDQYDSYQKEKIFLGDIIRYLRALIAEAERPLRERIAELESELDVMSNSLEDIDGGRAEAERAAAERAWADGYTLGWDDGQAFRDPNARPNSFSKKGESDEC